MVAFLTCISSHCFSPHNSVLPVRNLYCPHAFWEPSLPVLSALLRSLQLFLCTGIWWPHRLFRQGPLFAWDQRCLLLIWDDTSLYPLFHAMPSLIVCFEIMIPISPIILNSFLTLFLKEMTNLPIILYFLSLQENAGSMGKKFWPTLLYFHGLESGSLIFWKLSLCFIWETWVLGSSAFNQIPLEGVPSNLRLNPAICI